MDEVDLEVALKGLDNLHGLALAEEAVVDKDARELVAHGPVYQSRRHCGVHPTGKGADDLATANLALNPGHTLLNNVGGRPVALEPAYAVQEVLDYLLALGVCTTSGWNWRPRTPASLPMTATGELSV